MSDLEQEIADLKKRIESIEARNQKVELDKAWETSNCRKLSIIAVTYFVMCLVFWTIKAEPVLLNAIVPTVGFFLSTLSLPVIRHWWKGR